MKQDWREAAANQFAKHNELFLNWIEDKLDDFGDEAALEELVNLKTIIASDANIDNEDQNVLRIIHHIDVFIDELQQEVEYETLGPEDEGMDRETKEVGA